MLITINFIYSLTLKNLGVKMGNQSVVENCKSPLEGKDAGDAEPAGGSAQEVSLSTSCWDAGNCRNPQEVSHGEICTHV